MSASTPRVIWRTKEGKHLSIDEMSPLHAENACKLMIRRVLRCAPDVATGFTLSQIDSHIRLLLKYLVLLKEEERVNHPNFAWEMWCSMSEKQRSRIDLMEIEERDHDDPFVCDERCRVQSQIEQLFPAFFCQLVQRYYQ